VTDDTLVKRAADGDEAAFLLLYERHRDVVLRFAYRFLGSTEAAEDVTHDAFLRILQDPRKFDPARASFRTYICAVARHVALTRLRHTTSNRQNADDVGDRRDRTAPGGGPLTNLIDQERACAVRRAILELPVSQREVVVLFEYEELSLAEVAAVVGAGVGAVKARLHRARERLRNRLAPYFTHRAEATPTRKTRHDD